MKSQIVLHIRDPFLLDLSTYLSLAVMSVLGISRLSSVLVQLIALGLCLIFGLLYWFMFRTGFYERRPALYFGGQAVVLTLLFLLKPDASDTFNFLFYILTIHAAVVLTLQAASLWAVIYFVISGANVLIIQGANGFFAVLFYLVVFVVCGILGHTLQQTELERERNQQLLEELQAAQQKLQSLAVVEERNRLARDLHDSVKQQVFAISMQLGAARASLAEGDKAYQPVTEAERLAKQASAELTTLIRELRPAGLDGRSLPVVLKANVEDWSRQNGIPADFAVEGPSPEAMPPDSFPQDETLFRVTQEALANIARHGNASQVNVKLDFGSEDVVLTIEDNGRGFDPASVKKGVGLDSMRERLDAVGGQLEISSQETKGTTITAKVRRSF